jgi:hypothetical protein
MKRTILPILLAILLTVIIFTGCEQFQVPGGEGSYYGSIDTLIYQIGEKVYHKINIWSRLDSITLNNGDSNLHAWFSLKNPDTLMNLDVIEGGYFGFGGDYSLVFANVSYSYSCQLIRLGDTNHTEDTYCKLILRIDSRPPGVDKPNIYIYPTKKTRMTVSLDLPEGGKVTESIPEYPKKWKNIRVKPDGTINNKYDFLFYEADLPGNWQKEEGWCIPQKELKFFFMTNLRDYGFNKKEITDFIEWWIPRLTDKPYYKMYPQHTAKINEIVPLKINKDVDSLLRLFYFIEGSDYNWYMTEPVIPTFKRDGFVVTEWGVSVK